MKNLKKLLLCATILILAGICWHSTYNMMQANTHNTKIQGKAYNYTIVDQEKSAFVEKAQIDNTVVKETLIQEQKDSLKHLMIKEVSLYINSKAPKANKELPNHLVTMGLSHNMDISFMMAQAQYETCFGTMGAGRPTSRYSLFGVCSRYNSYEEAINKYIALLKKSYLVNGKTEKDLLNNYVTNGGYRYSESSDYERRLRTFYNGIINNTKVKDLQKQYNRLT